MLPTLLAPPKLSALAVAPALYPALASRIEQAALDFAPHLGDYAEFVFGETGFELITGGCGPAKAEALADLATCYGLHPRAVAAFEALAAHYPEAMLGLKLALEPAGTMPTLYVRTKETIAAALPLLQQVLTVKEAGSLRQTLRHNSVLYGLGFTGQAAVVLKTYVIQDLQAFFPAHVSAATPGFVSYRIEAGAVQPDCKYYLPDVDLASWQPPTGRLAAICRALLAVPDLRVAGNIGVHSGTNAYKIYVEQVGAIATDFAAR
ncbi:MAG: hypothetical protein ACRYFZ_28060 [Janthinobacterium lividum]